MPNVLIVDDDLATLRSLARVLEQRGFSTIAENTIDGAKQALKSTSVDLALVDVFLPGGNGIELLLDVPRHQRPVVVLMSGAEILADAIKGMDFRAVHFLRKPIDMESLQRLLSEVREACEQGPEPAERSSFGPLVGASTPMRKLYELIERVAPTNLSVLIEGESGTGKELVAAAIHQRSGSGSRPFVALNCGAVPSTLIDSELFGHERGAFTGADRRREGVFQRATGGTLFLDEITEMPVELQTRLLRVLETGKLRRVGGTEEIDVDVRVLAATNRPIEQAVEEGVFRDDLRHRLGAFPMRVPPLRDRGSDIELLANHFLQELNRANDRQQCFDRDVIERFATYDWPGNVRELRNEVQYASVLAQEEIQPQHLSDRFDQPSGSSANTLELPAGASLRTAERYLIEAALARFEGNKRRAAASLGISVRTLYNRLNDYART